ncbi:MAG TPA: alpha-amylase family protein [Nocardioides sp.]|uniref:alpha-amylase family protein n=1 Tax=Nocardioides sp. TaxID=35761 RepID=UPI002D806F04|nr:alpha-amylase family protein [Nocardioides sp.]HET6653487.1 alpha-amylase family protein [Nocardioides sp.]
MSRRSARARGSAPPEDRTLRARMDALWPDVVRPLRGLYGDRADFDALLGRLRDQVAAAYAERSPALRALDERRLVTPDWFQRSDVLGYVCYVDRFAGTLPDLLGGQSHDQPGRIDYVDYLRELGVGLLHLMPLLRPRPGPNDGGYAVADYRDVDPRLGSMDDLRDVADVLRGRGISLVLDLVCNHTAREHEWAERARAGDPTYLAYYRTYPDRTEPDRWERTLPEVFPDFAPGNFTWVPECERWVWSTFNDYQWDLDYSNPDVFADMFGVICHLANVGVEVLRLDAVAFMWKRLGTNCQNQPEVHLLLQAWRALSRIVAPGVILLAEAIVSPDDLVGYLGQGEGAGKECQLAYHNVLMVSLWSALAEQNATLLTHTLRAMPPIPPSAAWLTYVRLHDDIGWAVTDENAGAVGLGGYDHRAFLSDFYSGEFPGSFARGEVFQANPATGDRRISGSLASLAGLELALERGDDEAAEFAVRRILLLHHLILTFGGIPLIYMGDEIGLRNDPAYAEDPDLADDNRWLHRPRMDWTAAARRTDPGSIEGRIFSELRRLVRLRAGTPELHAQAEAEAIWHDDPRLFMLLRTSARGDLLILANVAPHAFDATLPPGWDRVVDLVTGQHVEWRVAMAEYQVRWLRRV